MPMVGSVFTRIIPSNLLGTRVGNASILRGKLHNFRLVGIDGNLIPPDAFGAGVTPVWMMTLVASQTGADVVHDEHTLHTSALDYTPSKAVARNHAAHAALQPAASVPTPSSTVSITPGAWQPWPPWRQDWSVAGRNSLKLTCALRYLIVIG